MSYYTVDLGPCECCGADKCSRCRPGCDLLACLSARPTMTTDLMTSYAGFGGLAAEQKTPSGGGLRVGEDSPATDTVLSTAAYWLDDVARGFGPYQPGLPNLHPVLAGGLLTGWATLDAEYSSGWPVAFGSAPAWATYGRTDPEPCQPALLPGNGDNGGVYDNNCFQTSDNGVGSADPYAGRAGRGRLRASLACQTKPDPTMWNHRYAGHTACWSECEHDGMDGGPILPVRDPCPPPGIASVPLAQQAYRDSEHGTECGGDATKKPYFLLTITAERWVPLSAAEADAILHPVPPPVPGTIVPIQGGSDPYDSVIFPTDRKSPNLLDVYQLPDGSWEGHERVEVVNQEYGQLRYKYHEGNLWGLPDCVSDRNALPNPCNGAGREWQPRGCRQQIEFCPIQPAVRCSPYLWLYTWATVPVPGPVSDPVRCWGAEQLADHLDYDVPPHYPYLLTRSYARGVPKNAPVGAAGLGQTTPNPCDATPPLWRAKWSTGDHPFGAVPVALRLGGTPKDYGGPSSQPPLAAGGSPQSFAGSGPPVFVAGHSPWDEPAPEGGHEMIEVT